MYQTFQEPEDPGPGQVVKKENDREHKVFKVKLNLLIFIHTILSILSILFQCTKVKLSDF